MLRIRGNRRRQRRKHHEGRNYPFSFFFSRKKRQDRAYPGKGKADKPPARGNNGRPGDKKEQGGDNPGIERRRVNFDAPIFFQRPLSDGSALRLHA